VCVSVCEQREERETHDAYIVRIIVVVIVNKTRQQHEEDSKQTELFSFCFVLKFATQVLFYTQCSLLFVFHIDTRRRIFVFFLQKKATVTEEEEKKNEINTFSIRICRREKQKKE